MSENCMVNDCRQRELNAEITSLRSDLTAAREVIEPLLDHYLECYEGNADQLVRDTRAFLERTATLRPEPTASPGSAAS